MPAAKSKNKPAPNAKDSEPSKGGRPSLFRPEFVDQAEKLCALGATDVDLAEFFNVNPLTIYRWQTAHPEFCNALKAGKASCDDRVERSLYHRAVGYSFDAEKIHVNSSGDVTRVPYREHVPPDTTAMIFWLKNRRRDEWRDRQDVVVTTEFDDMTDAQLMAWIAERQGAMRARH